MPDPYECFRPFEVNGVIVDWPDSDHPAIPKWDSRTPGEPTEEFLEEYKRIRSLADEAGERLAFMLDVDAQYSDHPPLIAYQRFSVTESPVGDVYIRNTVGVADMKSKDLAGMVIGSPAHPHLGLGGWWVRVGVAAGRATMDPRVATFDGRRRRIWHLLARGPIVVAKRE